jgi:hypothetical protein
MLYSIHDNQNHTDLTNFLQKKQIGHSQICFETTDQNEFRIEKPSSIIHYMMAQQSFYLKTNKKKMNEFLQ